MTPAQLEDVYALIRAARLLPLDRFSVIVAFTKGLLAAGGVTDPETVSARLAAACVQPDAWRDAVSRETADPAARRTARAEFFARHGGQAFVRTR
jgi:hypothetical protein